MNRAEILAEAARLIDGDRKAQYGNTFPDIAAMWSIVLGHEVRPDQVALCMAALKLVRVAHKSHEDGYVDAAGYIALAGEMGCS